MNKKSLSKVMQLFDITINDPILFQGLDISLVPNAVVIPANIPSSELGIVPDGKGKYKCPTWVKELIIKSKKANKVYVCIDGLDGLTEEEQSKFYGMFKYNGINGFRFPEGTRVYGIVKDMNKVAEKIKSLALTYKVE